MKNKFKTRPNNTKRENRDIEVKDSMQKDVTEDFNRSKSNKPSQRNGKTNKRSYKGDKNFSSKSKATNFHSDYRSESNPFDWYNAFPQVIRDAGNLPFGVPLGSSMDLTPPGIDSHWYTKYTSPGLMRINFVPGIGWSADKGSPINRAALKMFVYLRAHQKAAKDYDSQDMMMMIMALDSLYSFHRYIQRIYGCMSLATPVNKYMPKALLKAQRVNYDDLMANMSDFRGYINQFAISLGSYTLPGNIDIIKRHMWMCSGLYADQNSAKAQLYMFVPRGFWKYDNTVTNGSKLTFEKFGDSEDYAMTFQQIKSYGNRLLQAILGDDDAGFISGDLLAAFGEKVMASIPETPEGYRVLPSYDMEVLSQIQNLTLVGFDLVTNSDYSSSNVITQDPTVNNGAIIYKPMVAVKVPNLHMNALLNIYDLGVTPEQVVEMTRLTAMSTTGFTKVPTTANLTTKVKVPLDACSADIVTTLTLYVRNDSDDFNPIDIDGPIILPSGAAMDRTQQETIGYLTAFDWAPQLQIWGQGSSSDGRLTGLIWESDNVTSISATKLAELQEAAFVSLFNVPEMAFTTKV